MNNRSIDLINITNQQLIIFVLVAILLWIIGFLSGNYHFINYDCGVIIPVVIIYLLRQHQLKDNKEIVY